MSGTSQTQVRRKAVGTAVAFLILLMILGGGAGAGYAFVQANGSLEAQSQRLFSQQAAQVKDEIDKVFSPALDLLQQSILNAESGFVPMDDSAHLAVKLVKGAMLKVYPGASHGLCSTLKDQINSDLLAFIKKAAAKQAA